ncbi:MAG TPA: HupE/UreJ family protein [Bryobacteraceae bacterium]|jgi:hypothetical protein
MRFLRALIPALVFCQAVYGHQQPTTLVVLDIGSDRVGMDLHVPLNELELAFGHDTTVRPEERLSTWEASFRQYLVDHIHPYSEDGRAWQVSVGEMSIGHAEQAQSGPFQEINVHAELIPPTGASLRDFVLHYDVILHQVVTHKALISVHSDWASGRIEPTQVGVIAVNTGTSRTDPLAIHLGAGSRWEGFRRMVALGSEHIREGLDHLLFLLVLLLPATLGTRGRYSVIGVVRIVTAFTIGHSLTLLAGALHWVALPQQPVEVLIAGSILVTAIHAIRPIFPGREAQVAAGFGLVHGLAFATVLAGLKLEPAPMALSIFGFNLGIELTQLFVIAMTMPWLILLSRTDAGRWVRFGGALLAGTAAIGWMVNRVTGLANGFEQFMETVTRFAPLGILVLALVAIPSYLHATFRGQRTA